MTSFHARYAQLVGVALLLVAVVPVALYLEVERRVRESAPAEVIDAIAYSFALLGGSAVLLVLATGLWQLRRVGTALHVTNVAAEIELARLRERLQGALDREREFNGHVAHELRTPLTVLTTGLDLLLRKQSPGSAAHTQTRELLDTVDEMRRLIDNLLLLARVERGADATKLEPVGVYTLVDTIWQRLADKAQARGLELDNRVPEDYMLDADRPKLRMVLQNLLANAVSYTERGGSIVVSTSETLLLSVWDSGPELPPEHLERVFDRMWRADKARTDAGQHAGIGLSLARALARQMEMDLVAETPAEGGVRFALVPADRDFT